MNISSKYGSIERDFSLKRGITLKFKYHKSYRGFYLLDGDKFKRPYKKLDQEKTIEKVGELNFSKKEIIDIEDKHKKHDVVAINWGYAKIDEGKVVILADGAVYVSGNSESELANSLEAARNLIESMSSDTNAFAATISKMENVVRAR